MDCDHLDLARRLQDLGAAAAADPREFRSKLERLRDFVLTHFGLEESLMMATHYPRTEEHVQMHERLVNEINQALERNRLPTDPLSHETLKMIEDLHLMHIRTDDARFGQWLNRTPS